MSDTVRVYDGRKSVGPMRRRRGVRAFGGILFTLVLAVILGYGCWTTRDLYPLERLIPARQAYQIVANDLLAKRAQLSQSRVWQALPASLIPAEFARYLNLDSRLRGNDNVGSGMPEWILNNLVPGMCHICGNDLRAFSDVLFVAKMTRVGCLLERLRGLVPGLEQDFAGGLDLYRLAQPGLPHGAVFYAVRGRVLLVSPSRDSLIRALTLRPEDAWDRQAFYGVFKDLGSDDLCGMIALGPNDPFGAVFKTARFAFQIEPAEAIVKIEAALRPESQESIGKAIGQAPALLAPPKGILEISLNAAKPLREVWNTAGELLNKHEQFQAWWDKLAGLNIATGSDSPPYPLGAALTGLLGPLGPGIRLTWLGMDLNEMAPVPQLVATADVASQTLSDAVALLPPVPQSARAWKTYLRWDPEKKRAWLPCPGGPSMQPTCGLCKSGFLLSTSSAVAEAMLNANEAPETLPRPGNLYVAVHPLPCLQSVLDAVALLADAHLLDPDIYGPEPLKAWADPYLAGAATVEKMTALAALNQGQLTVEARVTCTAEK